MTSLAEELEAQRTWRLRPQLAHIDIFERLVRDEFVSPEEQAARLDRRVAELMAFAGRQVAYYRRTLDRRDIDVDDVQRAEDLPRLPVLGKTDVLAHQRDLRPLRLPPGEAEYGWCSSSGTTGRPTRVLMTVASNQMFTFLQQRGFRWYRWQPQGTLALMRVASTQPRRGDGSVLPDGETVRRARWPYVGVFFETGPFRAFNSTNPAEARIDWLRRERPAYLTTYPSSLETLSFACADGNLADSLEGFQAISAHMPPAMRRRVERTFGLPVHQNYGLNEIGVVATRCQDGAYHVHSEHCHVEVVDEHGQPCPPGQTGRLVFTALRNRAMPLIRYDSGDMAQSLDGLCACGRTLPRFGGLRGRFYSWHLTPPNTVARIDLVRDVMESMPPQLICDLREYQLHQYRSNRYELRLRTAAALPRAFADALEQAWRDRFGNDTPLTLLEVDRLPPPPGGKQQEFTSDFFPTQDDD